MREAAAAAGTDAGALAGVGVGSPGEIDTDAGTVSNVVNIRDWKGAFPLGETLGSALGVPVAIANDVQVATEAEATLGAGKDYSSMLGVFWGTGVGGGIVLDGKPWVGQGSGRGDRARRRAPRAVHAARAGGADAWRHMPGAPRWRPGRAG